MKAIAALVLFLFVFAVALHAIDTPEFDRLNTSYKAAIEKATKPLTETYLEELQKLRDFYTRAAKLEAANKVQAEIDSIYQSIAAANAAKKLPSTAQTPAPVTTSGSKSSSASGEAPKMPETHWFVAKTWRTDGGTKFSFSRNGSGERVYGDEKMPFTWRLLESGVLELTPIGEEKSASRWYVKFPSRSEGLFGTTEQHTNVPLRLE
jgi:hypothetical protein